MKASAWSKTLQTKSNEMNDLLGVNSLFRFISFQINSVMQRSCLMGATLLLLLYFVFLVVLLFLYFCLLVFLLLFIYCSMNSSQLYLASSYLCMISYYQLVAIIARRREKKARRLRALRRRTWSPNLTLIFDLIFSCCQKVFMIGWKVYYHNIIISYIIIILCCTQNRSVLSFIHNLILNIRLSCCSYKLLTTSV